MKTTDLDAIIASVPIDKTAARQMSGGIHWAPNKKIIQAHRDAPALMMPVPEGVLDLTGRTVGRFKVVGFLARSAGNAKGALWQVRCACGQYETRRSRAIRNRKNIAVDCCEQCRQLQFIKRREHFLRHGKNRPSE